MASSSSGTQPTWVPYEPSRDCSQGLCSIYCPQWCSFIFPPPPPFDIAGSSPDESSSPTFSPLVIAIIGILASAFLLVSYYTIISKYCGTFSSLRNRVFGSDTGGGGGSRTDDAGGHGESRGQEAWNVSPSNGLDEALINKITVCKYKRGDGFVDCTDCSVCLSEFRDGENLRLLPKCAHAFHLPCIDTWLKSHSNCPLCRANIVFITPLGLMPEPDCQDFGDEGRGSNREVVVVIEDLENVCEEECHEEDHADEDLKHHQGMVRYGSGRYEESNGIVEMREDGMQPMRGSSSVGDHRDGLMSIADVLQASMEDEFLAAKESGLLAGGAGTSRRFLGEHSKDGGRSRALQAIPSPMSMKRSPSSGRSCFSNKNGRGKDSVFPM